MRLLLDTHIAIWAITNDARLSAKARSLIADPANRVIVSTGSIWEISIKHGQMQAGVRAMPISGQAAIGFFTQAGYDLLAITAEHAAAVEHLPALHSDPFDRILVAQSQCEPAWLLTHDDKVAAYGGMGILV